MFQRFDGRPGNLGALQAIEGWVRVRFTLPPDQLVLVSEEASGLPGFPALDTTVRFWTDRDTRFRLRIFKRALDVTQADLPPAFFLPSLIDDGDPDCC